jgi:hypothetical protein
MFLSPCLRALSAERGRTANTHEILIIDTVATTASINPSASMALKPIHLNSSNPAIPP